MRLDEQGCNEFLAPEEKADFLPKFRIGLTKFQQAIGKNDIALRTRHRSWDELNAYQVHPIHQEVLKHMKSVVEKSVAVDWEA